jgi:hypothetical protein
MIEVKRRNWTSQARLYSQSDAIVVSVPKSGRTWLRVFLYSYFCRSVNREFTISNRKLAGTGAPKVMFTHDLCGYVRNRKLKFRLLGKTLIPAHASRTKPILLLVRDPRDVVVSYFFQKTRRGSKYRGDLPETIRHPRFGVNSIVEILNTWMAEWGTRKDFKVIRYEDCRIHTEAAFREVLTFIGIEAIDEGSFRHALQFSSFENMKRMESERQFKNKILSAGNVEDPDSYKVRRGIVGGFNDYLGPADIHYMNEALTRLDQRFGYGPEAKDRASIQNPSSEETDMRPEIIRQKIKVGTP